MKKTANKNAPLVIGLTGQTGAGKSTVTQSFIEKGFAVIDCDQLTRELQSRPEILSMLEVAYGSQILLQDGSLNRKMLAAIAFSEPKQTEKLNKLMLPPICEEIKRRIAQAQADGKKYILLDAPTLFESGLDKICDRRVSVLASEEVRLQRILVRDKIDEQAARRRMSAQHPDSYYTVRSDFVLRNNGTREELLRDGRSLADELTRPVNQDGRTAIITLVCIISVIAIITGIYQLTFRIVYQRDYPATVAALSEQTGLPESYYFALAYCGQPESETDFSTRLEPLFKYADETDLKTLSVFYYAGEQQTLDWLADSAYSTDGLKLDTIPDEAAEEFANKVESAQKMYHNLYE